MMDGLPGREVVGQQAPGASATHDVEDGVDDLAEGVYPGSPGSCGGREMGLYVRPLGIGEVGLVCSSHARYSTELPLHDTFSDGFRLELSEVRHAKPSGAPSACRPGTSPRRLALGSAPRALSPRAG